MSMEVRPVAQPAPAQSKFERTAKIIAFGTLGLAVVGIALLIVGSVALSKQNMIKSLAGRISLVTIGGAFVTLAAAPWIAAFVMSVVKRKTPVDEKSEIARILASGDETKANEKLELYMDVVFWRWLKVDPQAAACIERFKAAISMYLAEDKFTFLAYLHQLFEENYIHPGDLLYILQGHEGYHIGVRVDVSAQVWKCKPVSPSQHLTQSVIDKGIQIQLPAIVVAGLVEGCLRQFYPEATLKIIMLDVNGQEVPTPQNM